MLTHSSVPSSSEPPSETAGATVSAQPGSAQSDGTRLSEAPHEFGSKVMSDHKPQYRQVLQPVPMYVLDRLSKPHFKDGEQAESNEDPFVESMKGDWRQLLSTINERQAYSGDLVTHEDTFPYEIPNLEEKWGGDRRLMRALNSDVESEYGEEEENSKRKRGYVFTRIFDLRSKARYWMSPEKRKDWKPALFQILLTNSFVPLLLRQFTFALSVIALGLAGRIEYSTRNFDVPQQPSSIMVLCVQSCAIIYLCYISYDEFTSQPLGLRDPTAKIRLILLDLLFIIFSSANLALAFNTLYDNRWVCEVGTAASTETTSMSVCDRQRTLAAFLFIILCMWVLVFTVSIFRVVQIFSKNHVRPGRLK
ncbi:unnamed protein product [Kuraishia capsulata CBS 1993]|uniref:Regulator of phospholipase D SRF1 n=1 Tax=Kuraishia capsulata CBS 1993 TaxID=1382522 RepID=W6MXV7_9ASCO|nr:uncharacterized protein KUCA_T00005547001 [Kuraishia capsulata CBS 1993]CDK29555.1 unnamed protein product [Kuraishia capsulata CBS 1993]